jgi:uncharacterized protein (UPF0261 family)
MTKTVAVLTTLDTKGAESQYLREQIEALGGAALLIDMGVVGAPGATPDVTREEVAAAGGSSLDELLNEPTRQKASPVMIAGATALLRERIDAGSVHAVLGLGGTQGTSNCTQVMQALPYGFPKLMVSTVASGDTSAFVGIKDVTMAFSVGDILGLNPVTRKILANAAGAAYGMTLTEVSLERTHSDKPVIGMTNLGVLTDGAMHALELFNRKGYEVIVFHAVGSGGLAMEQMMKEGLIGAVFDYALGEIPDEVFDGLRAASPERLTVAGELGLPQVLVPGGAEHIGLIVEADTVPERYKDHIHTFHNPIIFAPRLNADEMARVAQEIGSRLQKTRGDAVFFFPKDGVSRYSAPGGPLRDPAGDAAFFDALRANLPDTVEVVEVDTHAEDPAFVEQAVERLIGLIEAR